METEVEPITRLFAAGVARKPESLGQFRAANWAIGPRLTENVAYVAPTD
jgi:hypothetical protein